MFERIFNILLNAHIPLLIYEQIVHMLTISLYISLHKNLEFEFFSSLSDHSNIILSLLYSSQNINPSFNALLTS